jgi:hypothetical protein
LRDSISFIFALIAPLSVVALIRFDIALALAFVLALEFALALAFAFALEFTLAFAFEFFDVLFFGEFGLLGGLGVKRTLTRILFGGGAFSEGLR